MNNTSTGGSQKESLKLEVWKHYGSIGGADKDQMIKIVTWLLTVSAGIVGFYASGQIRVAGALLFSIGALVSLLAAFMALLYGGYSAWNWAIADRIAERFDWPEQQPSYRPIAKAQRRIDKLPLFLAKPCTDKIALVFWVFFGISLVSFGVHITLLFKWYCETAT